RTRRHSSAQDRIQLRLIREADRLFRLRRIGEISWRQRRRYRSRLSLAKAARENQAIGRRLECRAEARAFGCCLATVEKERYKNWRDRLHPKGRVVNVADPGLQHYLDRRFCRAPLLFAPRHDTCR